MTLPPPVPYALVVDSPVRQHLRLLGIFHLILGALAMLVSSLPIIHIAIGVMMLSGSMPTTMPGQQPVPAGIGWVFILMGGGFLLVGYAISICMMVAGYKLIERRSPTFCFVVACVECLFVPFGTILGIFSIVVLSKPECRELFEAR